MREYRKRRPNAKIEMKPICVFDKEVDNFTDRELSCMEYSLIHYLQPRLNREGVTRAFRF